MIKNIDSVKLYTDAGIRHGIAAIACVAVDIENEDLILFQNSKIIGEFTSNVGEYMGLILGLENCIKRNIRNINILMDSQLVVRQVLGSFKTNKSDLIECRNKVMELLSHFDEYTIKWVPRTQNKRADKLVNEIFKKEMGRKWEVKKKEKQLRKRFRR